MGGDNRTFLPTGPERDLIAGKVKAALRLAEHLCVCAKLRVAFVNPSHPRELHVVPADGDPMLDGLGKSAGMQPLALLPRQAQPFVDRKGVELLRTLAAHVGAGERTLRAEITGGRVPDLVDGLVGP